MRVENKKARFDYDIVETIEAGVILTGAEVKSIKGGQVNLTGSRVIEKGGRLWVVGMSVPKYQFTSDPDYDTARIRQLLLRKKEIGQIEAKRTSSGLTLIPLCVYNKGNLIKVAIGLARGKKKYEKREQLKKRTEVRELARRLKG